MSSLSLNNQPPAPGSAVQDFHHQEPSPRQHQHIFSTPVSPTSESSSRFSRAGGILGFKTGPSRKAAQVSSTPPLSQPAPLAERSVGGVKRTALQPLRSGSAASTDTVTLQDSSEMAPTSAPVRVHQYGPPSTHHTSAPPASNAIHGNTARSSSTSYVLAKVLSTSC